MSGESETTPTGQSISAGVVERIDAQGGAVVVIQRDQTGTIVIGGVAHDVSGLANPYLGLRPFTYDDRRSFAGRETVIAEATALLTRPGEQRVPLFITGASGSGKSSLAQAGVVPALEEHYRARHRSARVAVFRPSRRPMAMLADALLQLGADASVAGRLEEQPAAAAAEAFAAAIQTATPLDRVNVLVIDQFEELFTQAAAPQREALVAILSALPPFAALSAHVILTMRSDYLGQLFNSSALYDLAKQGIELRQMTEDELRVSIVRPLQAFAEEGQTHRGKLWEAALVDALAQEAAASASYLPLLQVTLEEIWKRGKLTLAAYREMGSTLTDAISQRATRIYQFTDYDAAFPTSPRTEAEREAMMAVMLDLVDVSVDARARADVRRRRTLGELVGDSTTPAGAARVRLVEDLTLARLLSTHTEGGESYADLIHESLIANWDQLEQEIDAERQRLRQRAHFELGLREWQAAGQADEYLLTGIRLAEALELRKRDDIALRAADARQLLERSVARQEEAQRRELEQARARAAEQQRAARQALLLSAGLAVLLVLASAASLFAWDRWGLAQRQSQLAISRQLAAQATTLYGDQLDLGLLLSLEAYRRSDTVEARSSLLAGLQRSPLLLALMHGHTDAVRSVAFSPDGRLIASSSGGADPTIRVWDVTSRRQVGQPLAGHTGVVRSVAFSPDGRLIASGGDDKTIRFWDVARGAALTQPITHQGTTITAVAFSPDGRLLAAAGGDEDRSVRLWDVATRAPAGEPLAGHVGAVRALAFSPTGQVVASAGADRAIRLWDVPTGRSVREPLAGHTGGVSGVAFAPDGTTLASTGDDGTVRLWDVASGSQRGEPLSGSTERLATSVAFSPDGRLVASADGRTVRLWDTASARPVGEPLTGHAGAVFGLAFGPDGQVLASAGEDRAVWLWDIGGIERTAPSPTPAPSVAITGAATMAGVTLGATTASAASTPSGMVITVAGADDNRPLRLWDTVSRRQAGQPLAGDTGPARSFAYSPDGRLVALAGNRTVRLWDMATRSQLGEPLVGHSGTVRGVAFSPDGRLLASASEDGTVRLWDVALRQPSGEPLTGHADIVTDVAFSPDGKTLVSADGADDGTLRLWDVTARRQLGEPLRGHAGAVSSVALSPDGRLLASAGADQTIRLWDVAARRQLGEPLRGHSGWVYGVAFSPSGTLLASVGQDRTVRLWDVGSRRARGEPLTGHIGAVRSLAFSPDGKLLASAGAGDDRAVRLWDVAAHRQLGEPLLGHTGLVYDVAFAPGGKTLASSGEDRTVRLWDTDVTRWQARACQRANRSLNASEWAAYLPGTPFALTCPAAP